jgi:fumarate reductase subunit D
MNVLKKTLAQDSPPAPTLMVVSNALAKMVSSEMGQLVLISMSVLKVPTTVVRMLHASTDLADSAACATADSKEME